VLTSLSCSRPDRPPGGRDVQQDGSIVRKP